MSANVEILRRGHEGFTRGDLTPVKGMVADDVEWGTIGDFPGVDGVYRGPDALDLWMEAIRSAWTSFHSSVDEVVEEDGDVVVIAEVLRGKGRGSGVEVEMRIYSAYWFEGGKIAKRLAFTDRDEALEAAGLSD